jgi:colanic acid/amylovoran biosynthesis glycosyltransferase
MRIVIITNTFPAYSETFISNKVKWLSVNNEILVLCTEKNENLFNQLFKENKAVKACELNSKSVFKNILTNPVQAIFAVGKNMTEGNRSIFKKIRSAIINSFSPDIIHFEFSGIATDYLDEMENLKGRKVVSCRGSAEKVKLLNDDNRKENLKKLFDTIDAIHCVSDDMRKTILPYCKYPEKIFINYPSIDTTVFENKEPDKKNEAFTILSIGRFTFQKGYLCGLLAVKKLLDKNVDFKWLIVGDGQQKEEITFHIHQLQLQNNVELLGMKNTNEIIDLYKGADVFFLPSVYEGIANVALEAMSMQLPVVSTKSGGMEEVITTGVNGFLAEIYDADKLAVDILLLQNDFEVRKKIGNAARAIITSTFDIHIQIQKFEKVYKDLITAQTVSE